LGEALQQHAHLNNLPMILEAKPDLERKKKEAVMSLCQTICGNKQLLELSASHHTGSFQEKVVD
jgi:hypothetical protein